MSKHLYNYKIRTYRKKMAFYFFKNMAYVRIGPYCITVMSNPKKKCPIFSTCHRNIILTSKDAESKLHVK